MSSIPKTCKAAAVKKAGGPFELIDVPVEQPKAGEILVKVLASGVCHSDAIVYYKAMPGVTEIPGHEIVGEVVALGEGEKVFKVGQRVGSGWHGGHDSTCKNCRRGDFVTCEAQQINGVSRPGGYSEYCTLRSEACMLMPEGIDSAEAAPLLCAGVTVFNSIRNMPNLHGGDIVGVQGIGGLGHLALQVCKHFGFHTVALSSSASKEKLAKELGAHTYLDGSKVNQAEELQKLGGAKLIVATAPNANIIKDLINALAVDGTLLILAVTEEDLQIPSMSIIQKRLSVRGWPSGTAKDSEDCINFVKLHDIKCQIEKFPLADAQKAFDHMLQNKVRFRSVLIP